MGRGLAVRWARAGCAVVVGSRDADRAQALAAELADLAGPGAAPIAGAANPAAAEAPVVCVAVPYAAQAELVVPLAPLLRGRIVVGTAVPMVVTGDGPSAVAVPQGSAALALADSCPGARVVAALHTVSARHLLGPAALAEDVLVTSDDAEARAVVVDLIARIPGLRALDAGPLAGAAATERLTPVLLRLNRRYRTELGLRLSGLPDPAAAPR